MADRVLTFVICYDVVRSRARRRIATLLEDRMTRVQQSVFEARMKEKSAYALFDSAAMEIEDGDKLRMYVLSPASLEKCRNVGGGPLPEDGAFWLL